METGKIICYAIAAIFFLYAISILLPYLVVFLALCGTWYLYQEFQRNNRRH